MIKVKQKAILMIFLIVFSTLSFPSFAPKVKAQENKECCEKTTSGDFCVYTDSSQCDQTKQHALTTCENTDYCSLGCCFDSDSGECFNNVANSECKSAGERTFQKGDCSQIAQCSVGCCQLSNQAFISTLTKCKQVTSQYPNVEMKFDPGIQDEYTCLSSVKSGVKGCCVQARGQCSFTTAEECGIQKTLPPSPEQQSPGFENCIPKNSIVDTSLNQQCCSGLEPVQISTDPNAKPVCKKSSTETTTSPTSSSTSQSNQISGQAVANFNQNTEVQEKTGFFEGYLCSNDELPCEVAKLHHLSCYNEDVYWFDSGNNPENVFLGNSQEKKSLSYSQGRVLQDPDSLCTASPNDENCGNCDYTQGTLCGEKDGEFICEDLNCKDTTKDNNSPDASGGSKELGESWCLYDGPIGPDEYGAPQDRAGSRHFRASCINGEQIIEPCKDFREELCTQSYSNDQSTTGEGTSLFLEITKNLPQLPFSSSPLGNIFDPSKNNLGSSDSGYSEAACRQNRFDTCAQCNTLSSQSQVQSCCEDISTRDCSFLNSGISNKGGICVPLVKPGLRFWADNNLISSRQSTTNNPTGSAILEITGAQVVNPNPNPVITNQPNQQPIINTPATPGQPSGSPADTPQIRGNQNLNLGTSNPTNQGGGVYTGDSVGNDICSQANVDCEVGFTRTGWDHILGKSSWKVTYNPQCLTDDAFTAAHSVCRSIGDCGAYFNYVGVFTEGGFDVKAEGPKGALAIPDRIREKLMERARPNLLKYALEKPPKTGGGPKKPGFSDFFKKSALPLTIIGGTSLIGLASNSLSGLAGGFLLGPMTLIAPFAGIGGVAGAGRASMASSLQSAGFGKLTTLPQTFAARQTIPTRTVFTQSELIKGGFKFTETQTYTSINPTAIVSGDQVIVNPSIVNPSLGVTPGVYSINSPQAQTLISQKILTPTTVQTPPAGISAVEGSKDLFRVTGNNVVTENSITSTATAAPAPTYAGYALGIANAIAWIWTIYELVDWLAADTQKGKVGFICKAWEAPDGGSDCEKCNDETKPCSEYRCKSLGKLCSIVNAGTDHEICTNIQPNDAASPRIRPDKDYMKAYQIQEDSNNGFTVVNKIPPFTPVKLGLITDEAAQCKFTTKPSEKVNSKDAFDAMEFDFGSSYFLIKHNMTFMLPSDLATQQALQLTNGGQYTIYLRCKDSTGNANGKDYYIKFAIEAGPDLSPPEITSTSITSGTYMQENINEAPISIFVNEPAVCKWEPNRDIDFDAMQNQFNCASSGIDISSNMAYQCSTTLNLEKAQSTSSSESTSSEPTPTPGNIRNVYYFRCKDKAGNKNIQGYPYTLISTNKLEIVDKSPQGELKTGSDIVLSVTTSKGAESGRAICGYSQQENMPFTNMPAFVNTLSTESTQPLSPLKEGNYKFYITCVDKAGNEAKDIIEFSIKADKEPPKLVSVYKESGTLHITTDEPSTCQYSDSDFSFGSGSDMSNPNSITHEATLINQIYIIKCTDEFNNPPSTFTVYP